MKEKKLKSEERSIYFYITGVQGKKIKVNTGQKISPQNWDSEKERAYNKGKFKYAGATELNDFLDTFQEEIKKCVRMLLIDNISADYEAIKQAVNERLGKATKSNLSFFEALDLFEEVEKE